MRAMLLDGPHEPLRPAEVAPPAPEAGEVRIAVSACGVCRTDLHILDGELPHPKLPLVLGHQIVGTVEACGGGVEWPVAGERVGVPWLAWTDGECAQCRAGRENLCLNARFTGYTVDGGYAEQTLARADACLAIPADYGDTAAAPLLCAGLIGFRALRFTGDAQRLGLYGFGSAAHIVAQVAIAQGRRVFAFTRGADAATQTFARSLGVTWAGDSLRLPPEPLDAAIIFAPAGELVPAALRALERGGVVVCAGIHMSDIPSFPYELLWEERVLRSVANLTHADGRDFMQVIQTTPVHTRVVTYPLAEASTALEHLRRGEIQGSAVLDIRGDGAST